MEKEKEVKYCWHGEPIKVEFGYCYVKTSTEKPMMWYNYECAISSGFGKEIIPAIRITTKEGESFVISNQFGFGISKVLKGGWPNHGHKSLPKETFRNDNSAPYHLTEFDLDAYEEHESNRTNWQKKNWSKEDLERHESLLSIIRKSPMYRSL